MLSGNILKGNKITCFLDRHATLAMTTLRHGEEPQRRRGHPGIFKYVEYKILLQGLLDRYKRFRDESKPIDCVCWMDDKKEERLYYKVNS